MLEGVTLSSLAVVMSLALVAQRPEWPNVCLLAIAFAARLVERWLFPRKCADEISREELTKLADRVGRLELRLK